MHKIYLDNSATTAMDQKVIEVMNKSFSVFGNPSSLHSFGQEARGAVDGARDFVAFFLDCKPTEVIFTSGGSESDNLAIRGIVDAFSRGSGVGRKGETTPHPPHPTPHVVTTMIEHHAVLHTIQDLEKEGKIEATYIKPDKNGIIKVSNVEAAIKPNTVLVSVMYVNNETGCVQPIREIGKMIEKLNKTRSSQISNNKFQITNKNQNSEIPNPPAGLAGSKLTTNNQQLITEKKSPIFFHCDAVQAAEFFEMGTKYLHVDLLTLTAHKIHGPKGTGVLFVKKGTPMAPQITGGEHEFRLRAGTENTPGIVGLAKSLELIVRRRADEGNNGKIDTDPNYPIFEDKTTKRVKKLRDKLENFILKNIPETYLNGDKELRAPHITNISFKNAEGEAIILNLDFLGIAVSSGSACTARSLESSHVLTAMDLPHELAHGAIRFSLSRETTEEEIDRVCKVLPDIIKKLREMSPFK